MTSLVPQRHQRIDFRRAPTRHVTSHQRYTRQENCDTYERYRIGWGDAEEHGPHQTRQTESADQTKSNANQDKQHSPSDHHSEHVSPLRSDGHANTDLVRALSDAVTHY